MKKTPPKSTGASAKGTKGARGKGGRPTIFSHELALKICEMIAGGMSLRSVCASPDIPGITTVIRWLAAEEHEVFRAQYARAREARADTLVEDMLVIADGKGKNVRRDALRVEVRKWNAARMNPMRYGDRIAHTGGADGTPPIQHAHRVVSLDFSEVRRKRAAQEPVVQEASEKV